MAPFHIKAQVLRQSQLEPSTALGVFEPRSEQGSDESTSPRKRRWQQSEIKRAIAAAEQAGLESYRVEIAPDGTIAIIVGAPADTEADPDSYKDFLGR
jgi:hypothetical protein